ncbi:MAG: response regulator, partial [Planctomycetaceae bacterium]
FSGPEGVKVARQSAPEVVLCDIGLPGMDGYGVARALREDHATRDAFLIAQSGYGQAEDVRKAYDAGFDVHLIKPVDFQELQRILRGDRPHDVLQ